jgi:hypothetical protein
MSSVQYQSMNFCTPLVLVSKAALWITNLEPGTQAMLEAFINATGNARNRWLKSQLERGPVIMGWPTRFNF